MPFTCFNPNNFIVCANPNGSLSLIVPSVSSYYAPRCVRHTILNLPWTSFTWQVTLLVLTFPLWQYHRHPKQCHSYQRGDQLLSHYGMGSSHCDWKDIPIWNWSLDKLYHYWDTVLAKLKISNSGPCPRQGVIQWLQARPLCPHGTEWWLVRRIVFFLSSSWHSFSFKYTVMHVPLFFQVMNFPMHF